MKRAAVQGPLVGRSRPVITLQMTGHDPLHVRKVIREGLRPANMACSRPPGSRCHTDRDDATMTS